MEPPSRTKLKRYKFKRRTGSKCSRYVERGTFSTPEPDVLLNNHTVLLLAGMDANFKKYDDHFGKYSKNHAPVIIIGAGRVGREAASSLEEMNVAYRVIETDEFKASKVKNLIVGDASDKTILERAGINNAPAVLITSHDDESNIYLTIYCRKLRPDAQIITRAFLHRNVEPLHRQVQICNVSRSYGCKYHF